MAERKLEGYIHGKALRPESLMMSYGYRAALSVRAIKRPIFQTSIFVFHRAEKGKAFFELAYGLRKKDPAEQVGLINSWLIANFAPIGHIPITTQTTAASRRRGVVEYPGSR
jgi:methionine-gamma-lyase